MERLTAVIMQVYRLDCLLAWAILTAVSNALGDRLSGDTRMSLEMHALSSYMLYESPDIVPPEIRAQIVRNYLVIGCAVGAVLMMGLISKFA